MGKAPGLGESRQREAVPSPLGALRDQLCKSQGRKICFEWECSFPQHGNGVSDTIQGLDLWKV